MKFKIFTFILLMMLSLKYSLNNYKGILIIISFLMFLILFGIIIYKTEFNRNKKVIIIAIILSLACCFFSYKSFIGTSNFEKIEITNISSKPILIDSVYLDGKKIKINKDYNKKYDVKNNASFKTEYRDQNKNTSSYKGIMDINDKYIIDVKNKRKIEIQIQKQKIDLEILINGKTININKFNYKKVSNNAKQMANYNFVYNIDNFYVKNKCLNNYIILLILFIFNFSIINFSFNDKKMRLFSMLIYLLELNPICNIGIIIKLILYIVFLLVIKNININNNSNVKDKLLFYISSIYVSFSLFGKYLIDSLNIINTIYFLFINLFIYLLFPYLMEFIDFICSKKHEKKKKITNKKIFFHRILVFFSSFSILYLYQVLFYPYIYLADGFMQINDISNNILSNWHPYLHTLMLKAFGVLFNDNLFIFIYFRIIIYSLLLNTILFYFYKKGMKLLYVYLIAIIFTILPTTGIVIVTLLKDVDFVIALVALTFYTYLIFNDYKTFNKNKFNYLFLLISLIGVGFFRHNGFYVSIVMTILLFILAIKNKKKILSITILIFILISLIIKFPLYKQLKVKPAPRNFDIATMIHGLDYIMTENKKEFSDSDYMYLTKNVLSYEDFKLYYDKYNIDILLHYNSTKTEEKIRELKLDKSKIIKIYLKQIIKSPIYLLKDRLYGTDIIWNVIEDDRINVLKYQVLYDEFDYNYKINVSIRNSKIITNILNHISNTTLLNILFFRVGFYLDILIILVIYQLIKKRNKSLISLIPLVLTLLTLFIAMHYQAFRYVWMVPSIVLLFYLFLVFDNTKS